MAGHEAGTIPRLFASDNAAGIHPQVLAAIADANRGHALAYGNDDWTRQAMALFREIFADELEIAFAFGGTGANIAGLSTLLNSYESIICAESSHLWRDEGAAPERWLGVKLSPVPTPDGKLRPADIEPLLGDRGNLHRAQPRVVSVSQPTEWGTVYSLAEFAALGTFCRANELFLHVDGARIANAAAALEATLSRVVTDCGVDVLSFGGTKNGLLGAEAVLAFSAARKRGLAFRQKQSAQLPSKMRFVAAQFVALLTDDLWLQNARHANAMAARLEALLRGIDGVEFVQPVETNVLFLRLPATQVQRLQERFAIHVWRAEGPVFRVMTSFDTTVSDVEEFAALLRPG